MGDTHPRAMEGTWGSGNDVSWPVECLLNGMNTSDHMMFGNGGSHGQVISSPFRPHRFQPQPQQPMHISAGLPLSSSINVAIPSHAMVEEGGQDQEMNNGASVITGDATGQDRHVPQNHPLSANDVLEDTDDGSEDDEEEEEVDEEMIMHRRNVQQLAHPHSLDESAMVPCQHQVPVRDGLAGLMPMAESHCHQKLAPPSVILRNGVGVAVSEHEHAHSHQQQHSHSMMPVFPQIDNFEQQGDSQLNQQGHGDPNSGYSVYGKMYFEGRIVLHLKQGNYSHSDPASICMNGVGGNGTPNFTSFGDSEVQKSQHFEGCAACRLRSPLAPENHRRGRDSHRHTIRGVLFTFEDCTIVELYPDQLPSAVINENCNGLKPADDANKMANIPNGHAMPMSSYLPPSMLQQHEAGNPKQRSMQHMEIEPTIVPNVNNVPPPPPAHAHTHAHQEHLVKPQQQNQSQEHTSWWDEFDSDADGGGENELREAESTEEESNQGSNGVGVLPSCMNGGGGSKSMQGAAAGQQQYANDGGENHQDGCQCQSDDEGCSQYAKYKCNICSDEFVSRNQLDSHICLAHSLSQNQSQNRNQGHGHSHSHDGTSPSIPHAQAHPARLELDMSSSSHNSSNTSSFERTNTPDEDQAVTTPTMTELDGRSRISSGGEQDDDDDDDCQSGLNIALSGDDSYSASKQEREQEADGVAIAKPSPSPRATKTNGHLSLKLKHPCPTPTCSEAFQSKKTLKAHLVECQLQFLRKTRKLRAPGRSKQEKKAQVQAKKRKFGTTAAGNANERCRNSKITHRNGQSDENCGLAKISGRMKKEVNGAADASASTRSKKMSLVESQRYNEYGNGRSQACVSRSPDPQVGDEDDSNSSSFRHFVNSNSQDVRHEDSVGDGSGSSSQDDEYESHEGMALNALAKNHKRSLSPSLNRRITKAKRSRSKGGGNGKTDPKSANINGEKVKRVGRADKSSQCEKCGKRFARKDKLMRHMYVHSEEKMFACHICEKRFSRRDKLSDHLKSHGSDEVHHCPMCKKEFLRPDILKQHVKLHGMGNKHQCPDCLRFVTGRDRLEKHMARHEEAKALGQTLLCPLCTKYFIQRQSLKAHIKKFHPDSDLMELNIPTIAMAMASSPQHGNVNEASLALEEAEAEANSSSMSDTHRPRAAPRESSKQEFFPCRQCGRQFAKRLALKKHQRRHMQEQHLRSAPGGQSQESEDARQILEETESQASSSPELSHCSILLSIASQIQQCSMMQSSSTSPLGSAQAQARSMSPVISGGAIDSAPSPAHAHAVLPTTHPPTPPLTLSHGHVPMGHHIHTHAHAPSHLSTLTSVTPGVAAAPPAHIPLVSQAQSGGGQQGNSSIVGMNTQGALLSHANAQSSPCHLGHIHHSSGVGGGAQGLSVGHTNAACSHGQLQANLSHHLPMSPLPLQHMNVNVGMTPPFSYYHYSYQ